MFKPKISIITPAYNCAKFLPQTIESVLKQTFGDFEMIIVDDGSTDNTKQVIEPYLKNHPLKIKYIYQQNGGVSVARNTAVKNALGEFIAFLDADDMFLPNRLEESLRVIEKDKSIGLVHARSMRINEEGASIGTLKRDTRFLSGQIFPLIQMLSPFLLKCMGYFFERYVSV